MSILLAPYDLSGSATRLVASPLCWLELAEGPVLGADLEAVFPIGICC